MPRTAPDGRLGALIDAAAEQFTARGVRLTRMSHVARALGVSPGTLYRYVTGKEALLDLCIQHAFSGRPLDARELPLAGPDPGAAGEHLRARLRAMGGRHPALRAALDSPAPADSAAEVERVVAELFDFLAENRRVLDFLERVARERPELSDVYFQRGRTRLVDRLGAWIQRRIDEGAFLPTPDVRVAARLLIETCAWMARHRHRDFDGAGIDAHRAREAVLLYATRALCKEVPSHADP